MRWFGILLLAAALAGCKAKKDDEEPAVGSPGGSPVVSAAQETEPTPLPRRATAACPECDGYGSCRRCGDFRPCLLCDGGGLCAVCGGDGEARDGACGGCGRTGECPDCGGDGVVSRSGGDIGPEGAPSPGQCPECLYGSGLCRDCGGSGLRPDGEACARCEGAKWCPDCRGAGRDVWCSGHGLCPSCEGHGQVVDGRPGEGWPELRLTLVGGETVVAKVLDRPGETISVERERGTRRVRESIVAKNVDPVGYLTALRRYLDPSSVDDHLLVAEFALARGEGLLPLASVALRAAEELGDRSPRLAAARSQVQRRVAARILEDAERALRDRKDARTAWELYQLVAHTAPAVSPGAVRAGRVEAEAVLAAEEAGLSGERRERRLSAESERLARAVRRAEEWRVRAEGILARDGAGAGALQRALRAADRARRDLAVAVSRAPASVDRTAVVEEMVRASAVGGRAIVAVALRLVGEGLGERARSLAALALARDPASEEAKRVAAVVAEWITRKGLGPEEGR